jgi:HAD superfamily hydrolase (TIGR01459 family)
MLIVLHDGRVALPHTLEVVDALHALNKKTVVVSNSSARASTALRRLNRMGFNSITNVLTSGELAWQYLNSHHKGSRCCWVSWRSHAKDKYLGGLDMTVSDISTADVLLLHGSEVIVGSSEEEDVPLDFISSGVIDKQLERVLAVAIERNIPVICSNIDFTAIVSGGKVGYMPGLIKAAYEGQGGVACTSFGKPKKEFFDEAVRLARMSAGDDAAESVVEEKKRRLRTLHIGDSLHHDIAGEVGCLVT